MVVGLAPMVVLAVVRLHPSLDVFWEDDAVHFWLVGGVGIAALVIALSISEAARRRGDARLFLVSLAFMASAGFLGLHALATPGVLLDSATGGFEASVPVGLFLAAAFAALSAVELSPTSAAAVLRRQPLLRDGLLALITGWAVVSLAGLAPLDRPIDPTRFHPLLTPMAVAGTVLFAVAAWRYARLNATRRSVLLAAAVAAFVALGEAMVAGVFARNWRVSWWEWHLLMAAGFVFVGYSSLSQIRREGGRAGVYDTIALDETLREVREDYRDALEALVEVMERREGDGGDEPIRPATVGLAKRFDLTERQLEVLERAAEALSADRRQLRRLGGMVEAGRQARVLRGEAELLDATLGVLAPGFAPDEIGMALVRDGALVEIACVPPGPAPDAAADAAALETLSTQAGADGRLLVVPLAVKGHAAGVLRLRARGRRLGERDRSLGESLATQLAITLENARLYHQLDTLFRSYMSPDVATTLLADPQQASLGGGIVELSALMADVVGFTTFTERSEPAEVVTMLNEFYGAVVPEILDAGGTVTQFVGDAVVSLFGAPVRHADHARRACQAALAFQQAVERVRDAHPGWPQFRVGVNTGPALVGNIGSAEMRHYTAIGDTVNLAARLESAAPHGQVVISGATLDALGDRATVEPLGEITVKGKAEPVRAYVLRSLEP